MPASIAEILNAHNVEHRGAEHHHVSHGWYGVDCPLCSPRSRRFRLGFQASGRRANCWSCGPKNPAVMLATVCRISRRDAIGLLKGLPNYREQPDVRSGRLCVPSGVGELSPAHSSYLSQRGFDAASVVRLWGIRGIGLAPRLQWRIWIPIRTRYGELVSWTTRAIGNAERRYISAGPDEEDVPHASMLYGSDLARNAIVICEGPLDAWAIGPGAVATLGISVTRQQIIAAARFPIRAVCFDASSDAQKRARKLCRELLQFPGRTVNIEIESGEDPAECDADEIAEIRREFLQ